VARGASRVRRREVYRGLTYADTFGLCKIEVGYTHAAGGGGIGLHAFIKVTAPDATEVVIRGGPTAQGSSDMTENTSGSGSSSGEGGGSSFGPIKVEEPAESYSVEDRDSKGAVGYDKPLVDDDSSCEKYVKSFERTAERINDAKIPYHALERNSNSVVNTLLRNAGIGGPGLRSRAVAGNVYLLP
jgi:hypothetical protein